MHNELSRQERARSLGQKLLSIYSPSGSESEIARFIAQELSNSGLAPNIDGAGNVICEIGSGSRSILLCPHIDTVPGELKIHFEGSRIYGRGASDAKGALLSMILAFEEIALRCKSSMSSGRVMLACVVGEEQQSVGLEQIISQNLRADAAIFGEPCGVGKIAIGYRGHVQASFTLGSKEVHASAPHLTNNSIELAFSLYSKIKERLVQQNAKYTVAVTQIHAGVSHNVIPKKTEMTLDVRIPFESTSKEAILEIERAIDVIQQSGDGITVEFRSEEPTEPYRVRIDSPIVRALSRSILKSGRAAPAFVTKSGTGDMNSYANAFGVDCVTYGPGDPKLSHTDSEYMDIEEVLACAEILTNSATEYFSIKA
jgi:[amino group carrier protein]-lysine/ornithine hydrolase